MKYLLVTDIFFSIFLDFQFIHEISVCILLWDLIILIIATEPSDIKKRNKVWSMQGDFFKSPNSSIKNATSFSTLYYT